MPKYYPYKSLTEYAKTIQGENNKPLAYKVFFSTIPPNRVEEVPCPWTEETGKCVSLSTIHYAIPCDDGRLQRGSRDVNTPPIDIACEIDLAAPKRTLPFPKHMTRSLEATTCPECLSVAKARLALPDDYVFPDAWIPEAKPTPTPTPAPAPTPVKPKD